MAGGTALRVRELAKLHDVSIPAAGTDLAYDMAAAVNRLEGVLGDETVDLVGLLLRGGYIGYEEAGELVKTYNDELFGER